ncbi:uncharacterized protein LOC126273072 [Schistocerca gregaria]|uniref:uncharacterized protein LOC126273072 n=1 Tax=Schistocerca gregaria TaxID=7010 RepID=UPI00211E6A71|nr:uncharacterized protein LOC126273072 [Schistocerca gregaria]
MTDQSVEDYCTPLAQVTKPEAGTESTSTDVESEEEDEKRDKYDLQAWASSISAITSLSEFALSHISDHPNSDSFQTPPTCPCDEECDLDSCGSSCSFIPTREFDSNRTIITVDGFSPMHVSEDTLAEKELSVALQTDPVTVRNNCTQTHRRRPGVAQSGMFSAKKTSSDRSPPGRRSSHHAAQL